MNYKYNNQNNNENFAFSSNKFLNFVFATGFFNLLYIFLIEFPSLEFLSYFRIIIFIFTSTCSFIFIYFLLKILLLEIFLKKSLSTDK